MQRPWLFLAATSGLLAVAFGAFGAHGLRASLAEAADGVERLGWWQTGAQYHLAHALALGIVGVLREHWESRGLALAGALFAAGTLLFSGSLYAMAASGVRALGVVTPFGGLALLAAWAVLAWTAARRGRAVRP